MIRVRLSFVVLFVAWLNACSVAPEKSRLVEVNLVAINDFHGYLDSSPLSYPDPDDPEQMITMSAGGVAALGGLLAELRVTDPQLLFVSAGDVIGASPPVSNIYADEPSIEAMNLLGLRVSALGNHELDEGKQELLRQIDGGCDSPRPQKACQFREHFRGADFTYIAANVHDSETGSSLVPPYLIETVRGVRVAFVGAQIEDLASYIAARAMAGINVTDEAEAINAIIPEIQAQGADVIVAVVHQGGRSAAPFNEPGCSDLRGPIVDIVERLDPAIDLVLSSHTHEAYLCEVNGRSVTQAGSYGRMVTHLTLKLDARSRRLVDLTARNLVVDSERYQPDPQLEALRDLAHSRSRDVLQRPVARLAVTTVTRQVNAAGESPMGNLVADAQLAATEHLGAQLALMNAGGVRSEFALDTTSSPVTYAQVAAVHPFGGTLQVVSLTGAELVQLLEQQWQGEDGAEFKPLQVSHTLNYTWDASRPQGDRVVRESVKINGESVRDQRLYRVAVNAFLAGGGDNFSVFTKGRDRVDSGIEDAQALTDYLVAQEKRGTPAGSFAPAGRVRRLH